MLPTPLHWLQIYMQNFAIWDLHLKGCDFRGWSDQNLLTDKYEHSHFCNAVQVLDFLIMDTTCLEFQYSVLAAGVVLVVLFLPGIICIYV